jgi:hypothetical protein
MPARRIGAAAPQGMRWVAAGELSDQALPSLMRKVIAHALGDRHLFPPRGKRGYRNDRS